MTCGRDFSVASVPWKFPLVKFETGPIQEGKERPKREAVHSRLVGSRFNKRGNLDMSLILGSCKTSRSLHLSSET